ncbi:MAG: glucose-6-phosphate isomerase [Cytophagales bacterium]|nr:MAG: glucose-6-phosphate isomerase [Cytophagales bacterium]
MESIKINITKTSDFLLQSDINKYQTAITNSHEALAQKTGAGNDFLGWLNLPEDLSPELIQDIKLTANDLKARAEVIVVIGIGGSYLGSKAVIDALSHHFSHLKKGGQGSLILYAGQNICADYHADLLEILDEREFALIVISKSGTTTEPAIAFRLLKQNLEERYGKEGARDRIVAITDPVGGALRKMAINEGYKTFSIPSDVGGRYSVLTPVGLLPIALAGFDIEQLIAGAKAMKKISERTTSLYDNPVSIYAAVRNALYKRGRNIEILVSYHPRLQYFAEWWKQLYGESEGKNKQGIFPASVGFTCDLHSMGQWIQDGERTIFETVLTVGKTKKQIEIPSDKNNLDKMNYLAGRNLQEVNQMAEKGTLLAHVEGGVPNLSIEIPEINEYYLGQLIYFFEKACAISGYLLGVNPFDQPGVEAYKNNMFALLGKEGYEELAEYLKAKL